ncbi:FAD-binding oxidoreductase [Candidatus Saccharibacteria bacterium]|nr:FAD-binding oxidoreductase [Candidatus Saccharibacteria bacterium]
MSKIARYLNQLTVGNVFDAPEILEAYSTDRSALKIRPKIVALPESTEDVRKLMRFCYQLATKDINLPVTVRGSGLDKLGADLSNGLIISTEKLNKLLESDRRERLVRVQAGLTLKELNTALSINGLTIPVGGHDADTIGGLISNCPNDTYSGKYGGIMNYVERVEVVLANGEVLQSNRLTGHQIAKKSKEKSLEGSLYNKIPKVMKNADELIKHIRKNGVGLAGYPNIAKVTRRGTLDLLPLFFGAEGTLGVITEVILRAVPMKKQTKRVVATFETFEVAQKFLDLANSLHPKELNVYDIHIIKTAEETGKKLSSVTKKLDKGFVVFARYDDKSASALRKINSVRKVIPKSSQLIIESEKTEKTLNEFENSLISFLNCSKTGERVPLLSDFYLPARNLNNFISDLKILENSLGLDLAIFGSYSAGNYSLRPKFKLEEKDFNKRATAFLRAGAFVITRQGGSVTGGSPEGRIKAVVVNDTMPQAEKDLYSTIKSIFDRYNILNPGVKLGANTTFTIRHFRDSTSAKIMI